MSQQAPDYIVVDEEVESIPTAGQTSDYGCRTLTIVTGIGALLVGLFLTAMAGWVFQKYAQDSSDESPPNRTERGPGAHVDGQLAFRIEESRCGVDVIGVAPDQFTANGQYCVYLVRVRNVGDQPRVLLANPQRAVDSNGKKHEPDVLASEGAGPRGNNSFPELLWRRQETTVAFVFDIDPAVSIVALEFHDLPWSNGVRVDL